MRCWPSWRACPNRNWGRRSTGSFSPGSLSRQGAPPDATYLFKHALVQDAAYGTLLREPRRALHARIAEGLEGSIPRRRGEPAGAVGASLHRGGADREGGGPLGQGGTAIAGALGALGGRGAADPRAGPDCRVARHAGLAPRADQASGRARERAHALKRICGGRDQSVVGSGARIDRARAEALGEPPDDPLTLFSVLYAGVARELYRVQRQRVARAGGPVPGARGTANCDGPALPGASRHGHLLVARRRCRRRRGHFERAIALYDPASHRPLATRFGLDIGTVAKNWRALTLWLLGYPDAARAGADRAIEDARELATSQR